MAERKIIEETEARQADNRKMNLRVLLVATLVVAAGLLLLWLLYMQPDTTL